MKDEADGKIIWDWWIESKTLQLKEGKEKKECKGIKKAVIKKNTTHNDYRRCLFSGDMPMRKMNVIRLHIHEIFTMAINKIALSANDDKKIIREDKISTFSHAHYESHQ